jgi:hypothetical protein
MCNEIGLGGLVCEDRTLRVIMNLMLTVANDYFVNNKECLDCLKSC